MKALVLAPTDAFGKTVSLRAVLVTVNPKSRKASQPSVGVTQLDLEFDGKTAVTGIRTMCDMLCRHNIPFDAIIEQPATIGLERSYHFLAFRPGQRFLEVTDQSAQELFKSCSEMELLDRFRTAAVIVNRLALMAPIEDIGRDWIPSHMPVPEAPSPIPA